MGLNKDRVDWPMGLIGRWWWWYWYVLVMHWLTGESKRVERTCRSLDILARLRWKYAGYAGHARYAGKSPSLFPFPFPFPFSLPSLPFRLYSFTYTFASIEYTYAHMNPPFSPLFFLFSFSRPLCLAHSPLCPLFCSLPLFLFFSICLSPSLFSLPMVRRTSFLVLLALFLPFSLGLSPPLFFFPLSPNAIHPYPRVCRGHIFCHSSRAHSFSFSNLTQRRIVVLCSWPNHIFDLQEALGLNWATKKRVQNWQNTDWKLWHVTVMAPLQSVMCSFSCIGSKMTEYERDRERKREQVRQDMIGQDRIHGRGERWKRGS